MDVDAALTRHFGFSAFRPGQREACEAALAGRDVLVVMPTGSGKSLCYQLPALMRDDLTVVVSPLVALMRDQVDQLAARSTRVRAISGQEDPSANAETLAAAIRGELSLLYVSPERFSMPGFLERLARAAIGLFVVDEAHCVSQWGHDFRPDYMRLGDVARRLDARSLLASTATATPRVATDIARRLALRDPVRVATGFDRPNLSFTVAPATGASKERMVVHALSDAGALPAIVYAGTRAAAEQLAATLSDRLGQRVAPYHAGLDRERRAAVQRAFLAGETAVITATNAFGMGVDKPDVRTVVHASVPPSLEAYYQEAGRAGRDGLPARAVLIAERRDKALHVHFIRSAEVDACAAGRVHAALAAAAGGESLPGLGPRAYDVAAAELARAADVDDERARALIGHLVRAGAIEPAPAPPDRIAGTVTHAYDGRTAALTATSIAEASKARWRQYREIWAYVEGEACRRAAILRHFEHSSPARAPTDCCDVCDPALALEPPPPPKPSPALLRSLEDAILGVARSASPSVGRTTCAEILHGARTKKIERNAYDALPGYGCARHMRRTDILAHIDDLIVERRLATTGGRYPVLVAHASSPSP